MAMTPKQRAQGRWFEKPRDDQGLVDAILADQPRNPKNRFKKWGDVFFISGSIGLLVGIAMRTSGVEKVLNETTLIQYVGEKTQETLRVVAQHEGETWAHVGGSMAVSGAIGAAVGEGIGLGGYAIWQIMQGRRNRKRGHLRVVEDE